MVCPGFPQCAPPPLTFPVQGLQPAACGSRSCKRGSTAPPVPTTMEIQGRLAPEPRKPVGISISTTTQMYPKDRTILNPTPKSANRNAEPCSVRYVPLGLQEGGHQGALSSKARRADLSEIPPPREGYRTIVLVTQYSYQSYQAAWASGSMVEPLLADEPGGRACRATHSRGRESVPAPCRAHVGHIGVTVNGVTPRTCLCWSTARNLCAKKTGTASLHLATMYYCTLPEDKFPLFPSYDLRLR